MNKQLLFASFLTLFLSNISASTNQNPNINDQNEHDDTPLIIASRDNNLDTVERLIKNKVDIDSQNKSGQTALMAAVKSRNIDIIRLLIKNKAHIDSQNKSGQTALIIATNNDDNMKKIALLLLNNKTNSNKDEKNTLLYACSQGYKEMIKYLFEKNDGVNVKDKEIVKILINAGANIALKDRLGNTALDIAKKYEKKEIVILLKKRKRELSEEQWTIVLGQWLRESKPNSTNSSKNSWIPELNNICFSFL